MDLDLNDLKALFTMKDDELLRQIGTSALAEGFGAADITDEDAQVEGRRIVEQLKPAKPEGSAPTQSLRRSSLTPTWSSERMSSRS